MTRLAVGRAFDGLDVDPEVMSFNGDRLSLSGKILVTSYGILQATRDRIVALVNNRGEPTVPVTFTQDPSIDGYYRPVSSSCDLQAHSPTTGLAEWSIELERAGGGSLGQYEIFGFHAARTNPHSITNASLNAAAYDPSVGVPGVGSLDVWSGFVSTIINLTTGDGTAVQVMSAITSFPVALTTTYSTTPASAYNGACRLTTTYGAATAQLVTGLACPSDAGAFLLSNGLVRVSRSGSFSDGIVVEVWDGSAWESLAGGVSWRIQNSGANHWQLDKFQILANNPERISIRFISVNSYTYPSNGRYWLDLTVRRGSRFVIGQVGVDAAFGAFDLAPSSSIAATALTGGIRATSNDAAGNRAVWGVAGSTANTNNLTTGRITQSSAATSMPFMIGFERNGSSASGLETAQNTLYDYYDIRNESQQVVRR